MEQSLDRQKAIEYLAGDNVEICQQYREIARWFPCVQMMRNHAHDLMKVMTDAEKLRAFPGGLNIPAATLILWEMWEVYFSPTRTTRRWWIYNSYTVSPTQPNQERVASRAEHVSDALIALPASVNTVFWDRLNPSVMGPDDDSNNEASDGFVVLSDDEEEVQMVGFV
ncbi:hypothetical protein ZWY2020_021187 [Hordeum vulgare]|nr:hypothetical protein ZWY2020_021187 [Hordeum vulgare]